MVVYLEFDYSGMLHTSQVVCRILVGWYAAYRFGGVLHTITVCLESDDSQTRGRFSTNQRVNVAGFEIECFL